jgi:penicillin-binding protein 1A
MQYYYKGKEEKKFPRRTLLKGALALAFAGAVAGTGYGAYFVHEEKKHLPDIRVLADTPVPGRPFILDRNGRTLDGLRVDVESLPAHVINAFVSAEDKDFFSHHGVPVKGVFKAAFDYVRGRQRGGSGITQQLMKNAFTDKKRTVRRKADEAILAREAEKHYTKNQILGMWLDRIAFGEGCTGITQAASHYFGVEPKDLSPAQAASLAAVLPSPEKIFSLRDQPKNVRSRRDHILRQMEEEKPLSSGDVKSGHGRGLPKEEGERARAEPLVIQPRGAETAMRPEIAGIVEAHLRKIVGKKAMEQETYTVYTTLDGALLDAATAAARKTLLKADQLSNAPGPYLGPDPNDPEPEQPFEGMPGKGDRNANFLGIVTARDDEAQTVTVRVGEVEGLLHMKDCARFNPENLPPSRFAEEGALLAVGFADVPQKPGQKGLRLRIEEGAQAAVVALDPRSGELRAVVGGYKNAPGDFNRAEKMRRQPGSTFKMFIYLEALRQGKITPDMTFEGEDGKRMSARQALARSDNEVALQVLRLAGVKNVVALARACGVTSPLNADESLATGSYALTPIELASAYGVLASGGLYREPVLITRVLGPAGREIPVPPPREPVRVVDERHASAMLDMLRAVLQRGGTAARAQKALKDYPGADLFGKTGTNGAHKEEDEDGQVIERGANKDAWFAGGSPDLVCAVWTGYDDGRPLPEAAGHGANLPLDIWLDVQRAGFGVAAPRPFAKPGL